MVISISLAFGIACSTRHTFTVVRISAIRNYFQGIIVLERRRPPPPGLKVLASRTASQLRVPLCRPNALHDDEQVRGVVHGFDRAQGAVMHPKERLLGVWLVR